MYLLTSLVIAILVGFILGARGKTPQELPGNFFIVCLRRALKPISACR